MSSKIVLAAPLIAAALGWAAVSARQVQSVPGPGSGVATVSGAVKVTNSPPTTLAGEWKVSVANAPPVTVPDGDWKVAVANRPTVNVAPPEFVKQGGRYAITWTDGSSEIVTVAALAAGGWIRIDGNGSRQRWINLSVARRVDDAQ
jgi:hypothetical protein